tara:strand:- start:1923 stop:3116 length:1194 start_codon:yes stop_codon:yes gene_type:complete
MRQNIKKLNNIFSWWKILLISLFITIGLVFVRIYGIFKKGVFGPVYKHFLHEDWPIVSKSDKDGSILNIAYPDENIAYYVASFSVKNKVNLKGKIPKKKDMYFWSLTIYREDGSIYHSINDTEIRDEYSIEIGNNSIMSPLVSSVVDETTTIVNAPVGDTYCVILRVYKKDIMFNLFPDYIPNIIIDDGEVKIEDVMYEKRIKNSNTLENIFTKLFTKKFERINVTNFFKVDVNKFFLPAESEMSLVFPNPFAKYLMVFPKENSNVIKVKGILQDNIGMDNNNCRYVSFMASSFYTTSTDNSISFREIKINKEGEYILYTAFSERDAEEKGYDSTKDNHNILLWKESNRKPVLVYRLVSTAKKKNDEDSLFRINNKVKNIGYKIIEKKYRYAPYVIN